jgi:hypothetical protein
MTLALLLLAAPPVVTFEADVRPVLRTHCLRCHRDDRPRGELDMTSYAALMAGGTSGPAVVAGKPEDSPLYTMAAHLEQPVMPPGGAKTPDRELAVLKAWIAGGLVEKADAAVAPAAVAPTAAPAGGTVAPVPLARPTPVTAVAATPTLLAVAGRKQVLLFALPAGTPAGAVPFPEGEVHALRFVGDTLVAAGGVGGASGAVVGFEVGTWKRTFTVAGEADAVLAADRSADGKRLLFGGPTKVAKLVSLPDGKAVHTFKKPTDWVTAVAISSDGLLAAVGDRFGGLTVFEADSGKEFATLRGHTKGVTALTWRPDGDVLTSAGDDGTVRQWNLHSGTELTHWEAHPGGTLALVRRPDGTLATAGRDKMVRVWDADGQPKGAFGPLADEVGELAAAGDALVSGDWAGAVRVWPAGTAVKLPVADTPVPVAAVPVPAAPKPVPVVTTAIAAPAGGPSPKQAALKAAEALVEQLKEEAARDPSLAKAYLQACEVVLALKTAVVAEGNK